MEEGTHYRLPDSLLGCFPPGRGGAAVSVVEILIRGCVGGEQGDVQYPCGKLEFSHVVIAAGVFS